MEIEEKNVNYLINRCRRLENLLQKYKLKIEDKDSTIEVRDERIKELDTHIEHLEDSVISHKQRIDELIDGNTGNKEELELTERARVKWKIRCESLEERIKELEEKLENKE